MIVVISTGGEGGGGGGVGMFRREREGERGKGSSLWLFQTQFSGGGKRRKEKRVLGTFRSGRREGRGGKAGEGGSDIDVTHHLANLLGERGDVVVSRFCFIGLRFEEVGRGGIHVKHWRYSSQHPRGRKTGVSRCAEILSYYRAQNSGWGKGVSVLCACVFVWLCHVCVCVYPPCVFFFCYPPA